MSNNKVKDDILAFLDAKFSSLDKTSKKVKDKKKKRENKEEAKS